VKLRLAERKSLGSFRFGTNSFLLAPQMGDRVLSCLADETDETDVTGLVNRVTIAAPNMKLFIDNARMEIAAWACEASCWPNNPKPDLQEEFGRIGD
jgi:hypothetical protein